MNDEEFRNWFATIYPSWNHFSYSGRPGEYIRNFNRGLSYVQSNEFKLLMSCVAGRLSKDQIGELKRLHAKEKRKVTKKCKHGCHAQHYYEQLFFYDYLLTTIISYFEQYRLVDITELFGLQLT